jgi:gamma-glutamylcyclotransferase (GGCT)/AIG2-like uncharacterized protein YtfP
VSHLFIYGTLLPGELRWPILAPFVVDEGFDDSADGTLYDTGEGYPAAIFSRPGRITGRTVPLLTSSVELALNRLDEVEGAVAGLYRRISITTHCGITAWAYEYGDGLDLRHIPSGSWLTHRA